MAGDAIKMAVVLDHKADLREVRVVFAHSYDENATVMGKGAPHPISERGTDGCMRSRVDVEITLPRTVIPGVYPGQLRDGGRQARTPRRRRGTT